MNTTPQASPANEDLPILTDIVASGKPIPPLAKSQRVEPVIYADAAKYVKVPLMPIQPSTINFLKPLKRKNSRKRHALSSAVQNENSPFTPAPPSHETRIGQSAFQAITPLIPTQDEAVSPLLFGLFDENPERDLERQIVRLAEERAKRRAEQVVAEQWEKMQQTLMQEVLQALPEVVAVQLKAKQASILQNAMQTLLKPMEEGEQSVAKNPPALAAWVRNAPSAVYHPAPAPMNQETRIVEDMPPTATIRSSEAPTSKWG